MIAADTNIILRLFIQDDEEQSQAAIQLFSEQVVWVSRSVILEAVWVMRAALDHSREDICRFIHTLIHLEDVIIDAHEVVLRTLAAYQSGMDFADALHLYSANEGELTFYTFDKKLVKFADRLNASAKLL